MPSNLMLSDSAFPRFTEESTDEKVAKIQDYLFMLLEQLRYTLGNISMENFNEAGLKELSGYVTEPVTIHLSDIDGRVMNLSADVDGLFSMVQSYDGRISSVTQTADGLATRVSNAEGQVSTLSQTVAGFNTRISNAEGSVSAISQTVNNLSLSVSNSGTSSTIKLTSNGVQIGSTGTIKFNGLVTFSDLSSAGSTSINGANITSGTITGRLLSGCTVDCKITDLSTAGLTSDGQVRFLVGSNVVGGMRFDTQGGGNTQEAWSRVFLYTQNWGSIPIPLKLQSEAGMSLQAGDDIYLRCGGQISLAPDYGTYPVRIVNARIYAQQSYQQSGWDANYWHFEHDGIYYGNVKKV